MKIIITPLQIKSTDIKKETISIIIESNKNYRKLSKLYSNKTNIPI